MAPSRAARAAVAARAVAARAPGRARAAVALGARALGAGARPMTLGALGTGTMTLGTDRGEAGAMTLGALVLRGCRRRGRPARRSHLLRRGLEDRCGHLEIQSDIEIQMFLALRMPNNNVLAHRVCADTVSDVNTSLFTADAFCQIVAGPGSMWSLTANYLRACAAFPHYSPNRLRGRVAARWDKSWIFCQE